MQSKLTLWETVSLTKELGVAAWTFATTRATTLPLRLTAPTIGVLPEPIPPVPPHATEFIPMPVFGQAADESFIDFDNPAELFNILHEGNA
ncbi:MAG: hypothetical protein H0W86_12110, partial [Armatimonadetes bacterium]|nr:hypothetical protein [Armatimonadota bacterium]